MGWSARSRACSVGNLSQDAGCAAFLAVERDAAVSGLPLAAQPQLLLKVSKLRPWVAD
jgi:hypothetical protein